MSKKPTDIMTTTPITVNENSYVYQALQYMQDKRITCAFVLDDDKNLVGILHIHQCV